MNKKEKGWSKPNNVVRFDLIQVERNGKKDCQCSAPNFLVNKENRRISCKHCGAIFDAFDAFLDVATRLTKRNDMMASWQKEADRITLEIENKKRELNQLNADIAAKRNQI